MTETLEKVDKIAVIYRENENLDNVVPAALEQLKSERYDVYFHTFPASDSKEHIKDYIEKYKMANSLEDRVKFMDGTCQNDNLNVPKNRELHNLYWSSIKKVAGGGIFSYEDRIGDEEASKGIDCHPQWGEKIHECHERGISIKDTDWYKNLQKEVKSNNERYATRVFEMEKKMYKSLLDKVNKLPEGFPIKHLYIVDNHLADHSPALYGTREIEDSIETRKEEYSNYLINLFKEYAKVTVVNSPAEISLESLKEKGTYALIDGHAWYPTGTEHLINRFSEKRLQPPFYNLISEMDKYFGIPIENHELISAFSENMKREIDKV